MISKQLFFALFYQFFTIENQFFTLQPSYCISTHIKKKKILRPTHLIVEIIEVSRHKYMNVSHNF